MYEVPSKDFLFNLDRMIGLPFQKRNLFVLKLLLGEIACTLSVIIMVKRIVSTKIFPLPFYEH